MVSDNVPVQNKVMAHSVDSLTSILCHTFQQKSRSRRDTVLNEFDRYIKEPHTNWRINNVMEWWSDHEVELPHITVMAQKYLVIPASSAPSERVFSQLKLIVE